MDISANAQQNIIKNKEQAPVEQAWIITVRGRLVDEKNRPIAGGTVKVKKGKSAITDENGRFAICCADEKTVVQFSFVGFQEKSLSVKALAENPVVKLEAGVNTLREFGIGSKKAAGTKVDLQHKGHLNLGQVLEGAVPGLTLRRGSQTNTGEFKAYSPDGTQSLEEYYKRALSDPEIGELYPTFVDFKRAIQNGTFIGMYTIGDHGNIDHVYKAETATSSTGVIPELRGANSFAGGTSGMLVVIDGFARADFPADLPMNNVESVEVIRDPEECLKWGPKAAGGVILITTKVPRQGQLQINYSSNFYYTPAPDISAEKLRLASSADLLDYYKEAYDKGIADYLPDLRFGESDMPPLLSPAEMYLYDLYVGRLTETAFRQKWDSLAQISNRGQMKLLQRDEFIQNHSLSVTMGMRNYDFMVSGLWGTDRNHGISDKTRKLGLNMKHNLSLLKNKLKISLMANFDNSRKTSGAPVNIDWDPYQLLLDQQGNYVYNYNDITPDVNERMMKAGYLNSAYNPLEDTRVNNNTSNQNNINSNLNINWQLAKGLNWSTSITYQRSKDNTTDYTAAASSQGRTLINQYGERVRHNYKDVVDVIFHIPKGDILKKGQRSTKMFNVRTGLNFNHTFGTAHNLSVSVDGGATDGENASLPTYTFYGYNPATGRSLPVLTGLTSSFWNYGGGSMNPAQLLVPTLATNNYNRNITMNARVQYSYLDRFLFGASYNGMFTPNFGESPAYASNTTKGLNGSWDIRQEPFFKASWISKLELNVSASETRAARLSPVLIKASRQSQSMWNNAAIIVSGVNKTELSGQTYREWKGGLKLGLSKDRVMLSLSYTRNNMSDTGQWNARATYDIAREPWFRFPAMSTLRVEAMLQDINSYQGMNVVAEANSISDGGFSMPANNTQGILPPAIINKEIRLIAGILNDRFITELRYYNKTTAGLVNGNAPTDPATGLSSKLNYSKSANKGVEMAITAGIIRSGKLEWTVRANAAYNINTVINAPPVNFTLTSNDFSAQRSGYSADGSWGYRWAGLDTAGNPRVYNQKNERVTTPDSLSLAYLGRTVAPWSGALNQDLRFGRFFASVRMLFKFGHVMRRYMPVLTAEPDRNIAIRDRWRKPGDEAFTDIAGVAKPDPVRELLIRNSDNSLMPADHVRLREIQLGFDFPLGKRVEKTIKSLTLSAQVLNVAIWTWNKHHLDPEVVSNTGVIGSPQPRQYVLSMNASF